MNAQTSAGVLPPDGAAGVAGGNAITPLPGEPGIPDVASRRRVSISRKGLFAVGLLVAGLLAAAGLAIRHVAAGLRSGEGKDATLMRDRPVAAVAEPRRIEMPVKLAATAASTASAPALPATRIPALVPTADELAEPIGVRRHGAGGSAAGRQTAPVPEDAPVLLVSSRPGAGTTAAGAPTHSGDSHPAAGTADGPGDPASGSDPMAATSRNLQGYQRQLQGLLDTLTKSTALATGQPTPTPGAPMGGPSLGGPLFGGLPVGAIAAQGASLFGGQLQGSATPKVAASVLGNRSLTLPKGTAFTCALKTRVISAAAGLVGCQVQRNVFSDDGRVLLIERGSHLDGEYRIASFRPGTVRIPVLWTRIRTPLGVTVEIDSPGTGQLGESGIDGHVDNRWGERIGAAMLLSLIDDSVKLVIQNQTSDRQADTIVLPSTTANTSKLAEKVLDSTINIPPLIYQNQGGIVGIYVARDVDFSSVYELKPTASGPSPEGAR